jgi:predicted aminopeptidase
MIRPARLMLLFAAAAALTGCSLPYYWQAVGGQIELLRKRQPIARVLTDPTASTEVKAALESITAIREFAATELLLPSNGSYTSYVELERPYVVWNVIAADEFSVDPKRWCFPFAGCVSYRGYFDRDAAEAFQGKLSAEGLDTYSGGASAYSTLGYFKDPVLNTMLKSGKDYIAALLFHELAHQQVYIKDDSEFNEAFASAVEEYGMELWLIAQGRGDALALYRARMTRRKQFADLVGRQRTRLRQVYAQPISVSEKREAKAAAFAEMRAEYAELKERWDGIADYDAWFAQPLNNATLAAVATYRQWLPALRWRLDALGVIDFYAEMREIAELPRVERTEVLASWVEQSSAPSRLSQLR